MIFTWFSVTITSQLVMLWPPVTSLCKRVHDSLSRTRSFLIHSPNPNPDLSNRISHKMNSYNKLGGLLSLRQCSWDASVC